MTRQLATNYTAPGLQFPYGTVDTDFFQAEDVQVLAQAVDAHVHDGTTLGMPVSRLAANTSVAGPLQLADGSLAAPSLAFTSDPTLGVYKDVTANTVGLAGNLIGGKSGANFNITSLGIDLRFSAGSGNVVFSAGGSQRFRITAAGNLEAVTDNAVDIGASGANRPRSLFLAGNASVGANGSVLAASGVLILGTPAGGSEVRFQTNGVQRWAIDGSGTLYPMGGDNTMSIGSAGIRPSTVYAGSQFRSPDGSAGLPGFSFANASNCGLYNSGGVLYMSIGGAAAVQFGGVQMNLGTLSLAFGSSATAADVYLQRDGAANILALRNGVAAQAFNIYNTYTNASNYERLSLGWTSNTVVMEAQNLGTGLARAFGLRGGNGLYLAGALATNHWVIAQAGHFQAAADNSFDIGAAASSRPRDLYLAGNATIGGTLRYNRAIVTSATAGAASALPATPACYFEIYDSGGTLRRIPAYNT